MSKSDDKYIYGLDGKQHYTPNRVLRYSSYDLYNYILICLKQNGNFYEVLQDYIVRDFGDFHIVLEYGDINKVVIEVVEEFRLIRRMF